MIGNNVLRRITMLLATMLLVAATAQGQEAPAVQGNVVHILVNPDKPVGKIRRLHGTNLAAPLAFAGPTGYLDITQDLKELDIPLTRLHDAPLENAGLRLVDVPMLFPLFHADPQNPENYYFAQTDDYIGNCIDSGSKVLYRLGVSIEHSKNKYFIAPPADFDKWADICINIIRHYNEGWADGFHHNIEYWEIWNEPDIPLLWSGTWDDYIRLYVTAAKKIKQRFPKLKVGGPSISCIGDQEKVAQFLDACKRQNAPLDFFSWHVYTNSIDAIVNEPQMARDLLDKHGFPNTEVHLNEWHYLAPGFSLDLSWKAKMELAKTMNGIDGAAFICAVLSGWQDTPLDMGNYYCGTMVFGQWGLFDCAGEKTKSYFGMKAFDRITRFENRVVAHIVDPAKDVHVLAGQDANGKTAVLISCLKTPEGQIKLKVDNRRLQPANCTVHLVDTTHNLQPLEKVDVSDSEITLSKPAGSVVFLVELHEKR